MATMNAGARAALSVVLGAATGCVTNLVTGQWSWTLGVGLIVLVAATAGLAWWDHAHPSPLPRRTTVKQTSTGGSSIIGGAIAARGGSQVTESAENHSTIRNSTIEAGPGADVERKADDGRIEDNRIGTD